MAEQAPDSESVRVTETTQDTSSSHDSSHDEKTPLDYVRRAIHALVMYRAGVSDEAFDAAIVPLRKAFDALEFLYD